MSSAADAVRDPDLTSAEAPTALNAYSPPAEPAAQEAGGRAPDALGPDGDLAVTTIERRRGWQIIDLKELWRYRELFFFLTWRDVKVRYKQTVLGAAWAILQPLATMIVFVVFLGNLAGLSSGDTPYAAFVLAGTVAWAFFSNAITAASSSVIGSQNLVTKVYFPRLIIPMSAAGASVVDFLVACGLLSVLMICYAIVPTWSILLAPVIFLVLLIAALGVGTLLSALTVAYRDFRYIVPFGVQLWMFATPCIYMQADQVMGPRGEALLPLNPAYGLIYNFRQAVLGGPLDLYSLGVSTAVAIGLLLLGSMFFRRVERNFADII